MSRKAPRLKPAAVAQAKQGWRMTVGRDAHRQGHRSEWLAAAWLMLKGYQLLGFRLKTRAGEIDILARRGKTLAVVEVKRRASVEQALLAIGPDQYERLLSAGRAVLRQRPSLAGHLLRIDIVALAPGRFPVHRRGIEPMGRG